MSRSFHATWRQLSSERRYMYTDIDVKRERIKKMRKDLFDKHDIKKSVIRERKLEGANYQAAGLIDPSEVNIQIRDHNDYVHFPVTIQDLISVSKRLPKGILTGLDSVTLCLGKEYQEENEDNPQEATRDPYTGRICCEERGPIYTPPVLGTYYTGSCRIFLYAYVYLKNILPDNILEAYTRLRMLSTFAHEVAHHDDHMMRTGRGRWLMLNEARCEGYAESKEAEWGHKVIIPYLLETYPGEYSALSKWIKEYGGVEIPLNKLIDEFEGKNIRGMFRLGININSAIKDLFSNVAEGKSKREIMLDFAMDLHYGDYYTECLKSLDNLLSAYPEDAEALGAKADTLIHMEDYKTAESTASRCLTIDERNIDSLEALCDVYSHRKDWESLMLTSSKGLDYCGEESYATRAFLEYRINAAFHTGDYELATKDINELPEISHLLQRKKAYLSLLLLLEGKVDRALQLARSVLSEEKVILPAASILKSVINRVNPEYTLSELEKDFIVGNCLEDLI